MSAIIIGYGNPDREDDGVAWHVLAALARRMGRDVPAEPENGMEPAGEDVDFLFQLQLTPEIAEIIAGYERACFVDAHTGALPDELSIRPIDPQFQASPFTHHMTAETCLSIAQTLYGSWPKAVLVSIRGYQFGFSRGLSSQTAVLAGQAVEAIWRWLQQENP